MKCKWCEDPVPAGQEFCDSTCEKLFKNRASQPKRRRLKGTKEERHAAGEHEMIQIIKQKERTMQDKGLADKAIEALRELAGAAGEAVEKLWPMAVQATWSDGVATLATACVAIVAAVVAVKLTLKIKVPLDRDGLPDEGSAFLRGALIGGALLLATLVTMICVSSGLPRVLAPAGQTIFRILGR